MRIVMRQLVGARVSVLGRYGEDHVRVNFSPKRRAWLPSPKVELQDNPKPACVAELVLRFYG
jgi:hypothetical protein